MRRLLSFIRSIWYYLSGLYKRFREEEILLYSAAIAFNCVLCLIPLLLLVTSFLGMFIHSHEISSARIGEMLDTMFPPQPYAQQIKSSLADVIEEIIIKRTSFGLFGSIVLVWTATALFSTTRNALNKIFHLKSSRFFIVYILKDILWVLITGGLFLASNVFLWMSTLLRSLLETLPALQEFHFNLFLDTLPLAVMYLLTFVMFFIVYQFIPATRIGWKSALAGSLTTTVLWILLGRLFKYYLLTFHGFNILCGAYAFLLVTLVWIELSSVVFIVGGVVAQLHRERRASVNP